MMVALTANAAPLWVYRRRPGRPTVEALTVDEARQDMRHTRMFPWAWLGALYAGLVVLGPVGFYSLDRVALAGRDG